MLRLRDVPNWRDLVLFDSFDRLDLEVVCIHCGQVIVLGEAWVDDEGYVSCPVPGCSGSLIDFLNPEPKGKTARELQAELGGIDG